MSASPTYVQGQRLWHVTAGRGAGPAWRTLCGTTASCAVGNQRPADDAICSRCMEKLAAKLADAKATLARYAA